MDHHHTDYSQITEQIYVGSDLCRDNDCPLHSVEFRKLAIAAEINMEIERVEMPTPGLEAYLWLPVIDKTAPSMANFLIGTMFIHEIASQGKSVFVHCREGHSRSPAMVAAYFVRYQKMSADEAIAKVAMKRPEIHLEEVQRLALTDFAKIWN